MFFLLILVFCRPFDNFIIKHEAEEISHIRYQSHLQTVACKNIDFL